MTATAAAPATEPQPAAEAEAKMPVGWHPAGDGATPVPGPCVCRLAAEPAVDAFGPRPERLEILTWGNVVLVVPGAVVKASAFSRDGLTPVPVVAWRQIPKSWLP